MLRRWIIVIVLAGLTGVLTLSFLGSLANRKQVVVVSRPISGGQIVSSNDVALKSIHASAVTEGAFTKVEQVVGKRLGQTRLPGDQLTAAALAGADNPLVPMLESGYRAVAIKVTDDKGLLGTLRPGDSVSVVGIFATESGPQAHLLLTNMEVMLVPHDFRYIEPVEAGGSAGGGVDSVGSSSSSGQQRPQQGVVVLETPVQPISITVGLSGTTPVQVFASPVEVLPLLNNNATIHLALEPKGALSPDTPGASLKELFPGPTPTPQPTPAAYTAGG
ncbi:MAG: Flp pilus assembly protein CpaB [Thermoflexales bacterium]|nr:Flp pilus assembly protein CpaB [Thermoflexales bacterium]